MVKQVSNVSYPTHPRLGRDASVCLSMLAMTLGGTALAQQSGQDSSASVEEVTVSGSRLEQTLPLELAAYGNRVQLIDSEELERRGINDIAQALQTMAPSVYIQQKAGPFDYVDVSLQGSRSDEILWLVDGVRINNRLYNGTTPLDTIPSGMIERIEVLEGGQGLMYGTQAAAGVINVITKSFSRESDGQVALGFDSNDGRHISGYARGSTGPHEFVLYASSDDAEGFRPIVAADYQPSSTDRKRSYDVQTLGGKYGIDLSDRVRFTAGYQYTNADLDYPMATLLKFYQNSREEGITNAKLDWQVNEKLGFFIKGYYHTWDSNIFRIHNSVADPGQLIDVADGVYWGYKDYGVNALAKFIPKAGSVEYHFGFDQQNFSGHDDVLQIADLTEQVNAFVFQIRSGEEQFEKLKLAAGLRYSAPKNGKEMTVWNVSGHYNFTDSLFLRASLGTASALPDAEQLFNIDPCCTRGNPSLAGEESTNLNVSLGNTIDRGTAQFGWELVAFARDVKDLIGDADDGTGSGDFIYVNTDQTSEIRGWTGILNMKLENGFSGNVSYSQVDANLGSSNLQVDRVPEDTAKLLLNYQSPGRPFGASLTVSHRGEAYRTLSSGLGRQPLGDYTTADFSAYVEFGARRNHRLTGRVQNITDEEFLSWMQREFTDDTSTPYIVRLRGIPRTVSFNYNYSF